MGKPGGLLLARPRSPGGAPEHDRALGGDRRDPHQRDLADRSLHAMDRVDPPSALHDRDVPRPRWNQQRVNRLSSDYSAESSSVAANLASAARAAGSQHLPAGFAQGLRAQLERAPAPDIVAVRPQKSLQPSVVRSIPVSPGQRPHFPRPMDLVPDFHDAASPTSGVLEDTFTFSISTHAMFLRRPG